MSQQAARQEIQALYRSYMRVLGEWPNDKIRPNRDMKKTFTIRVEETFRAPLENNNEPFNLVEAKRQLDALERLLGNEFKQKYPLSDKILNPAINPNYYSSLLSSLGTTKDGKETGLAQFFGN